MFLLVPKEDFAPRLLKEKHETVGCWQNDSRMVAHGDFLSGNHGIETSEKREGRGSGSTRLRALETIVLHAYMLLALCLRLLANTQKVIALRWEVVRLLDE
jgi:hypothetical protein